MKIIVAPDSFKGSNSSIRVADLIEKGIRKVYPEAEIIKIPIADGGEGTVDAAVSGGDGEYREVKVRGPLGDPVNAKYGILKGGRAVIEMAAASGLPLVPEEKKNPLVTTTYGTGELIESALEEGCREFLLGIGGSATTDAGLGMAQALGYSFKDKDGRELGDGGGELDKLVEIDSSGADPRIAESRFTVASDVNNPLYGREGAAYIYGPQKGATPEMVKQLDANLRRFSEIVKKILGRDISQVPGSGAAGGLGAGLIVFCGAELKSGIQAVLDIVGFDNHIASADLIITGEGAIDGQTTYGKVPVGVAKRVQDYNLPVLAIVGNIGQGAENVYNFGIHGIMSTVNKAMSLSEAMADSAALLEDAAERVMRIIDIGRKLR